MLETHIALVFEHPIETPYHFCEHKAHFHVRQTLADAAVSTDDERLENITLVRGITRVAKPALWNEVFGVFEVRVRAISTVLSNVYNRLRVT